MKRAKYTELRKELRAAGARDSEIGELLPIAANLSRLQERKPSHRKSLRWKMPLLVSGVAAAGVALGIALVIFAQGVLPGSWLYPVQKMSDSAAVALHPSYRGTVMMKRADQVKQLVAAGGSPSAVLTALADYQSEAAAYKSSTGNYALFDYCKADLQQAARSATGQEHTAIVKTLASLQDV